MGFLTYCDNKGCRENMEPVLDRATDKILCTKCGQEIHSLTDFAKRQMVAMGQVKKQNAPRQAWSVKCAHCQKEGPPKLDKTGKELLCSSCEHQLDNIAKPFKHTLIEKLKTKSIL